MRALPVEVRLGDVGEGNLRGGLHRFDKQSPEVEVDTVGSARRHDNHSDDRDRDQLSNRKNRTLKHLHTPMVVPVQQTSDQYITDQACRQSKAPVFEAASHDYHPLRHLNTSSIVNHCNSPHTSLAISHNAGPKTTE